MDRRGFTMTEALIAAVIVAILVALAVPQFQRTTERSYWRSARDILETIYAGEQVYHLDQNKYQPLTTASTAADWNLIYMDDPNADNTIPVEFSVAADATTFTATATRIGGPCNGKTQTITQTRARAGDWPETGEC